MSRILCGPGGNLAWRTKQGARRLWRAAALAVGTLAAASAIAAPHALLSTHVPSMVATHRAAPVAPLAPSLVLRLAVALPLRHPDALNALLGALYDPGNPRYRHFLSVGAFTARFGPTAEDYAAAVRFFSAGGLHVTSTTPNRFLIDVVGTAVDIENMFHVSLAVYRDPAGNRLFFAPDREPSLDLAVPVLHVTGLDDAEPPTPRLIPMRVAFDTSGKAGAPPLDRAGQGPDPLINGSGPCPAGSRGGAPAFLQASCSRRIGMMRGVPRLHDRREGSGSGPDGNFTGTDIRAAYYPGGRLTGAGQSLGLMELGGFNIYDVRAFFQHYGPRNRVPVVGISVDGASLRCTGKCDDSEQSLDIEYAISMAPGLSQVQVYVGNTAEDVLNRMATDNSSAQLSTSWGWHENFETDDALFREMAAQGQSMLTASGDDSSLRASGPWPEEDANITAVGGTNLLTTGPGGDWKAENGWAHSAGGASLDKQIAIEPYQLPFINARNDGSMKRRNVPDIAAASINFTICADRACNGNNGGTSFAAPIWAGIVALANQEAAEEAAPRIGFLNPTLYALGGAANNASLFHDITKGHSGRFKCTASYDLVTGLGSPTGQWLIDALVQKQDTRP